MTRLCALVACAAIPAVSAQTFEVLSDRLEARSLRLEARQLLREARRAPPPDKRPPVVWDASIGVAYTDAEDDSKAWATPFVLKATFNKGFDALKVAGDGYTRIEPPGEQKVDGFSDLALAYSHAFHKRVVDGRASAVLGEVGYTLPSHSDVGSKKGAVKVGATFVSPMFGAWDGLLSAKLSRSSAEPPSGVSRVSRSVFVQAAYSFANAAVDDVFFQFLRVYRPGAGGFSQAIGGFDFPLPETFGGWSGSLSFARGLTNGSRDNSIGLDFSLRF
jgi:hypothetical protein